MNLKGALPRQVRHTERVIHAFISSRLDYCNSLLCGLSEQQLTKLQRLQNVAECCRTCMIISLQALHWVPVKYRIQYKVLLLVFRTRIGKAPPYMNEMLQEKTRSRALRSSDASLLHVSKTRTKCYGDNCFSVIGPKLWNALPPNIKNCGTIIKFKSLIKSYLFNYAFN